MVCYMGLQKITMLFFSVLIHYIFYNKFQRKSRSTDDSSSRSGLCLAFKKHKRQKQVYSNWP